jgi:flagellar biosynthesis protein FlhB
MELDELKSYWQAEQDKEFSQHKLTTKKLETMMNNTQAALQQIQQKNDYWYKTCKVLYRVLFGVWLVLLIIMILFPGERSHLGQRIIIPTLKILVMGATSMWFIKWQKRIFEVEVDGNLKQTLLKVTKNFSRFYLTMNITFLLLFPVYFSRLFAFNVGKLGYHHVRGPIVVFLNQIFPSISSKWLACFGVTVIVLALSHWYYHQTYFKRIKVIQNSLKELSA